MSSKNGAPELVSMLQYMKDTYLGNPEILVKDSRLLELDKIVEEVRESDEWEAVKMNILEIGKEFGAKEKLKEQIQKKLKKGCSADEIADMLEEKIEVIQQLISELEDK